MPDLKIKLYGLMNEDGNLMHVSAGANEGDFVPTSSTR